MSRVLIPVQPDSSTPCVLADAAPPPLSPSILVDPPQPPSHNRAASIPPEIVAAIVNHAVERLVVEESIAPDFSPRVNAFLRSASLVHSEWRPIAQIALLRQGTVSLRSAQGYLGALRTRGVTHMVRCLRVQAEPRALPLGRWAWAGAGRLKPGKVDLLLDHLVPHLPALELIECVGCDPSDQTLVDGFPGVVIIRFTKEVLQAFEIRYDLDLTSRKRGPRSLRFDDAAKDDSQPFDNLYSILLDNPGMWTLDSYHLRIQPEFLFRLLVVISAHPSCTTLHLASSTSALLDPNWSVPDADFWILFTQLHALTLPCHFLPKMEDGPSLPPCIRTLEVCQGTSSPSLDLQRTARAMDLLPELRCLTAPASWVGSGLEVACRRRGVALRWRVEGETL